MSDIRKVLLLLETSREYGRGLLRGIVRYANLHGSWIIERQTPFYLRSEAGKDTTSLKILTEADGIILREQKILGPARRRHIPVIVANFKKQSIPGFSQLVADDDQIGQMAAAHFLQRGFHHFAYLGYDDMFWSVRRKNSFVHQLAKAGYDAGCFKQNRVKHLRLWIKEKTDVAQWLLSLPRPTGLMACNDDRALQAMDACRQAGLKVPEEIAILGVDDDELVCNLSWPPLSSICLDLENAGYKAAALLDRMMSGKHLPPQTIFVKARHVTTRHSTDILAISDAIVVKAVRFIQEHVRQPLQISDVLSHVAISRRGLYDKFQQSLGCSVYRYIKQTRIEHIERLLSMTDMPIRQIALEMGFSSPEHISAYFYSEKGCNPLEFRKRAGI
ncbi:MAG: DNA-binding transcriptional regulator [Planctomycetes bacterium]|nr:DNA-binding transcriptional regulator [Planctomycetota bacterium]